MMKAFVLSCSIGLVLFSSTSSAALRSSEIAYYGAEFFQDIKNGAKDAALIARIKYVLRAKHVAQEGTYDLVVPNCEGQRNCYNHINIGYDRARTFLLGDFYLIKQGSSYAVRDVYCEKEYGPADFGGGRLPGPDAIPDDKVVNVEHTWPQSRFSPRFDKGTQKADLHHLFPTDSQLNAIRGNYKFGEVTREKERLKCTTSRFGFGESGAPIFEPPDDHKGNVARALFYFSVRYDISIDPVEEKNLRRWHEEDPVDQEELDRNNEIYNVQGNRNPFVDYPGLVGWVSDF